MEAFEGDTLRHMRATARLVSEYFATVDWIYIHADDWQLPLLVLTAGNDFVVAPEGGRRFFQQVNYPDKTLRDYPDAYHDLFNDYDTPKAKADIEEWLVNRLGS